MARCTCCSLAKHGVWLGSNVLELSGELAVLPGTMPILDLANHICMLVHESAETNQKCQDQQFDLRFSHLILSSTK